MRPPIEPLRATCSSSRVSSSFSGGRSLRISICRVSCTFLRASTCSFCSSGRHSTRLGGIIDSTCARLSGSSPSMVARRSSGVPLNTLRYISPGSSSFRLTCRIMPGGFRGKYCCRTSPASMRMVSNGFSFSSSAGFSAMWSGCNWRSIHFSTPILRTSSTSPGRAPKVSRLRACRIFCSESSLVSNRPESSPGEAPFAVSATAAARRKRPIFTPSLRCPVRLRIRSAVSYEYISRFSRTLTGAAGGCGVAAPADVPKPLAPEPNRAVWLRL